jgi:hypothetical protein
MENSPGALAGLVAALVALTEVLKYLVKRVIPPKQILAPEDQQQRDATRDGVAALVAALPEIKKVLVAAQETRGIVEKIWELHDRRDDDGVPLWYVPRSLGATLAQAVEQIRQVSEIQRKTVEMLERMDKRLERLERRRLATTPPVMEDEGY